MYRSTLLLLLALSSLACNDRTRDSDLFEDMSYSDQSETPDDGSNNSVGDMTAGADMDGAGDMITYDMITYDMVTYDMVTYDMVTYDMVTTD